MSSWIAAFRWALDAGVRITYSTDSGVYPHELVARHSGTIEVDTQVGAGTTFTVTLPRSQDGRPPKPAA